MRETAGLYALTDHVCRACQGRVLRGDRPAGEQDEHAHLWVCSNCGAQAVHRDVSSVCTCGIRYKPALHGGPMRDAGIRCRPNDQRSPEFPALFVGVQVHEERALPPPEEVRKKRETRGRRDDATYPLLPETSC